MANGTTSSVVLPLGSGAAKVGRHIGVEWPCRHGDQNPIKRGCSGGALVGAAYAHDHLPELEEWVRVSRAGTCLADGHSMA